MFSFRRHSYEKQHTHHHASLVLIAAAKLGAEGISGLTEAQEKAADVNMWGDVNASDAALILQYAAIVGTGEDMTMREFIMQ